MTSRTASSWNTLWRNTSRELIDEYVHDFRPTLLRGRNEDWLFPGQRRGAKGKISFSGQITERIYKATGLRMTVHQFRHAAGAIILKQRPGEYELVRQLLGHRSVQTTINSYIGLESIQASEIFSKIVMDHMGDDLEAARIMSDTNTRWEVPPPHRPRSLPIQRMARCRSASLGRCLPARLPSQAGRHRMLPRPGEPRRLCKAIRSILGVLAAKRSARARCDRGGAGHTVQCRGLYR